MPYDSRGTGAYRASRASPEFELLQEEGVVAESMTFVGVERLERGVSLREMVERALAAAIISGEMPPGKLVSAPGLAAQFNVSATPVREAMLNLEKRGFVEAVRNKGFRVTDVSEEDLRQIVGVRRLLEPEAMQQLAGALPEKELPELRQMADTIVAGAQSGDLRSYLEADQRFHLRLTALLGNPLLVEVVADLRSRTRLVGLVSLVKSAQLERSAAEHIELLEALASGDGDGARALMHRHIGHTLGWWAGLPEDDAESAH